MISNVGAETSQPEEDDNTSPPDLFKKSMLRMSPQSELYVKVPDYGLRMHYI